MSSMTLDKDEVCTPAEMAAYPMGMTRSEYERIMRKFGHRLRQSRLQAFPGLSAAKFAESMDIEPPTYRAYERGQSEPGFDNLSRICRTLKLTPNDLLPELYTPEQVEQTA